MKRAIVFGATGGIGQAVVADLAARGWSLYLQYNQQAELAQNMATDLGRRYQDQDFLPFRYDMAENQQPADFFCWFSGSQCLIFAQGVTDYHLFAAQSNETIDRILQINLVQPLKIVKYFEPQLLNTKHSRIIFIGSVYGRNGSALEAVYSTTKGGLSAFASAYAKEVATAGLTVNVVAPGAVATPMTADFSTNELTQLKAEIPVSRIAEPRDISYWVQNIVDERADYLTGQTIYVDGGWLV